MSGSRTKALRREFRRIHGRAPETKSTRRLIPGWFGRRAVVTVVNSRSEFRRFKRSRRAL